MPVVAIGERARGSTNVSLAVDDVKAAQLAFASDNGKVWLALRPSAGAKAAKPGIVTIETMLLGVPPVQVLKSVGGPAVNSRGFHVYAALEASLGLDAIRALPAGTRSAAVSLAEAGRAGGEIQHGADLVIVGCSKAHDAGARGDLGGERPAGRPAGGGALRRLAERLPRACVRGRGGRPRLAAAVEASSASPSRRRWRGPRRGRVLVEGEMITVLGPKGGTGKTVTSSNLAVALALEDRSSVLVDLDLQFGDVGLALGLEPTKTIYDLATSGGTLDGDKIEASSPASVRARALLAPLRPDQAAGITTAFLREVFEILRSRFDFVLVDTPPTFSPR